MNKTLGILALLLSGCIIYDQKGKCDNCDPDGYSDGNDGNGDQPDSGQDTDDNGRDTAETAAVELAYFFRTTALCGP